LQPQIHEMFQGAGRRNRSVSESASAENLQKTSRERRLSGSRSTTLPIQIPSQNEAKSENKTDRMLRFDSVSLPYSRIRVDSFGSSRPYYPRRRNDSAPSSYTHRDHNKPRSRQNTGSFTKPHEAGDKSQVTARTQTSCKSDAGKSIMCKLEPSTSSQK